MVLDREWAETAELQFDKGQSFVILLRDNDEVVKVIGDVAKDLAPTLDIHINWTRKLIKHLSSDAEMIFCSAENQYQLRGKPRDYKLIDPFGLANPEVLHRFR